MECHDHRLADRVLEWRVVLDGFRSDWQLPIVESKIAFLDSTDLAIGQPMEHGLRRSLLAVWLGEDLGFSADELRDLYYAALLGAVGCTPENAVYARNFKDEAVCADEIVRTVDPNRPLELATFMLRKVGEGEPPWRRAAKLASFTPRDTRRSSPRAGRRLGV